MEKPYRVFAEVGLTGQYVVEMMALRPDLTKPVFITIYRWLFMLFFWVTEHDTLGFLEDPETAKHMTAEGHKRLTEVRPVVNFLKVQIEAMNEYVIEKIPELEKNMHPTGSAMTDLMLRKILEFCKESAPDIANGGLDRPAPNKWS